MQKGGELNMDKNKQNGFRKHEQPKQPVILNTVADSVDIRSDGQIITLTFMLGKLDKNILPNHKMIVSSVIIDKVLANALAQNLFKHANRGNIDVVATKHDLPKDFQLPKKNE